MKRQVVKIISYVCVLLFISQGARAESGAKESFDTFTLYIENDYFAGTDYGYTGGQQMTWSTPFKLNRTDYHLPAWSDPLIRRLPFINDPDKENALSFPSVKWFTRRKISVKKNLLKRIVPMPESVILPWAFTAEQISRNTTWNWIWA